MDGKRAIKNLRDEAEKMVDTLRGLGWTIGFLWGFGLYYVVPPHPHSSPWTSGVVLGLLLTYAGHRLGRVGQAKLEADALRMEREFGLLGD